MRAPVGAAAQLLERDVEGRLLAHAVTQATSSNAQLLVIEGAAGIGKTSLLEELRDLGLAAGMVVRWSRGTALEQALAWSIVRQLLTQPLLDLPSEEQRQVLEHAAARAPAILGLGDGASAPLQFSEALHALFWLTVEMSGRVPLLLVVDDVQWADRESVGYLNYLGNRLEDQAILVALAIRSGEPESRCPEIDQLRLIPHQFTLTPGPLSRSASDEIVARLLGERAHSDVGERFHHLTGGNPFLLHELCRGVAAGGSADDAVEHAETTATGRVSMSVLSRLSRYPALTAQVAEAVAILGASATLYRLSRLAGASEGEVANAIGHLIDAEILEQPGDRVDFVHPLVRRAVYEHLNAARRQVMHAQAAKLLRDEDAPAGEVGAQLLRTRPGSESWRVANLRQAAGDALAVGAPEAASTYLRRALIEPPPPDEIYRLLLELGKSELHHDPGAAVEHFSRAHQLAVSPETRSAAAQLVARAHALVGDFSSALTVLNREVKGLDQAESTIRRQLDSDRLVFARWDYASQELRHQLFSDLRARADAGAELDRDERANLAHELAARGEDLQTAADSARWAIQNSACISGTDAAFVLQLMSVLVLCDLRDEAEEIAAAAVKDAESRGSAVDACAALTLATYCALCRGDVAEAVDRAQSALALNTSVWATAAVAWLGEALAERGEPTAAKALLREYELDQLSLTTAGEAPLSYQHAVLLHHRGRMRALCGDQAQALQDFLEAGELATGWRIGNPAVLNWRSGAAGILLALRRQAEAAELAHEELRLARRWGAASAVGTALRAAGMADPSSAGTDLLREAVHVHAGAPARLEYARSLVSLGIRLRRERQHLEARELLRKGLDVASHCSAVLLANQARDELVAAGAKPRRDAIEGADALTGRERRIAELAVQGLTNRQIAQMLFLSPRTVEHHLGNIYRKLRIQGRDELPAALERT